jgi:NitT/TauT family transport system permease protein
MTLLLGRLALIAAILGVWELSASTIADEFAISRPTIVAARFWELTVSGRLFYHGWITVVETLVGFLAGATAGIVAGLLLGRNQRLARLLEPILTAINSLPKVALAPLFIMWFGIDLGMKVILTATIVFFLVFTNTYNGVRSVDVQLLEILRLMGARERHLITKVIVPSALQWVFAGLELSIPYALIGAVIGEIMAANRGLGFLLQEAAGQLDTGGVFAALLAIILLALLLHAVVRVSERRLTPWKTAAVDGGAGRRAARRRPASLARATALGLVAAGLGISGAAWAWVASRDAAPADRPSIAASHVRVGLPTEGFFYVPLYLAIDAGLMAAEGIDVELVQFRGGGASIAGLASQSVEFCICAIHNAINATARGTDITVIGTVTGQYGSNVVLRQDVAARLGLTSSTPVEQRLAALRGLTIGATGVGSGTDYLIRYMAKRAQLSPERDFTVLYMGGSGAVLTAFAQHRIDGFVYSSPTSDIGLLRYQGMLLLDMSRGEFEALRDYPSMALSARRSWLEANRHVSTRFVRAMAAASRLIHDDPARARQILRQRFAGLPPDVYEAAWNANVAAYPASPVVEEANVERALAFLAAVQDQPVPGAARDYFDNSFVEAAAR